MLRGGGRRVEELVEFGGVKIKRGFLAFAEFVDEIVELVDGRNVFGDLEINRGWFFRVAKEGEELISDIG